MFSGSFGAVFNILLNFILVPVIGVYGAALATCISYIAVFMFRVFHTRKYIKYDIWYKEFILGSLLMILSAILMFVDDIKGFLFQLLILVRLCQVFVGTFFVFSNSVEKLCVSWALSLVECVAVWALKLPVPHTDVLKPTSRKVFLRNY